MCTLWTILLNFAKGNKGEVGESAAVLAGTTMASTVSHFMASGHQLVTAQVKVLRLCFEDDH
jgi:hypothetical protein